MRIGVFGYNFEHRKTQEGLLTLFLEGFKPYCLLLANFVKLNVPKSEIRIVPKGLRYYDPKVIAERLQVPYFIVEHNSKDCEEIILHHNLDLGIILGARILNKNIINAFNIGILNIHTGLLPENRGLDAMKWAIINDSLQGASVHLINDKVDSGLLVCQELVDVYKDDLLLDIQLRIENKGLQLMIKALRDLRSKILKKGDYHSAMSPDVEKDLLKRFELYKEKYGI